MYKLVGPSLRPLTLGSVFFLMYVIVWRSDLFCVFIVLPSLPPFWLDFELLSICLLFCFVIFWMLCYVMLCVKKKKNVDNKKKKMHSLRKHSEGGACFETATLIGLIADEWQFNYIQWTMRLVFLLVLTGGLAYRGCYGYGGPSSKPEALGNRLLCL